MSVEIQPLVKLMVTPKACLTFQWSFSTLLCRNANMQENFQEDNKQCEIDEA